MAPFARIRLFSIIRTFVPWVNGDVLGVSRRGRKGERDGEEEV